MDDEQAPRWQRRHWLAALLRGTVFALPVGASLLAAWGVQRALPPSSSAPGHAASLGVLLAVSTAALLLVDHVGRRLLPLATLLDLRMLFPDRAPSRLRVAREAIRRRPIEEQLRRVREAGADPGAVAREILTLVAALSRHDRPTRGHAERVRMFTDLLAEQMHIPARDRDLLRWAALLHDIGKLEVPASLLNKPGKPTAEEWALLKAHPAHGAAMAGALLPWLGEWADVIVQHHERYDGTGYPEGLSGSRISLGARIVSVADAYDVMTAARAYKRPVSRGAALQELVRFSGSQFDPVVVRAMFDVGVPRLRRAQGLLAWLADVPLVATHAVPAATVARVVGAGALATGAVTGAGVLGEPLAARAEAAAVTVVGEVRPGGVQDAEPQPSSVVAGAGQAGTDRASRTSGAASPALPVPTDAPAAEPSGPEAGASDGDPSRPGGSGSGGSGSGGSGPGGSGPGGSGSDGSGSSGSGSGGDSGGSGSGGSGSLTDKVGDAVDDPVGTVTDTVDDVVNDPVGTVTDTTDAVTDTVDDVVDDPVGTVTGTVTGTVDGTVGAVSGQAGTLLGGSPSPSPSSGGLVGGLLGR